MPYEPPAQPEAPRPPLSTVTVRGALLALAALLCALLARHIPPSLATPETQQIFVDLFIALTGIGATVSTYGARRAIGLWLAMLALVACHGPDLRLTLSATRATLGALRADYARGRIVITGAKPETLEALRQARVAEIDAADRALEAAERAQ